MAVHNANVLRVANISAHGALVEGETIGSHAGEAVNVLLYLPLRDKRMPINIDAKLVRKDQVRFAVEYDAPVDVWPRLLGLLGKREH